MFDRVQQTHTPRAIPLTPSTRLLARLGIVHCAKCGSRMVVGNDGGGTTFYRCPTTSRGGERCPEPSSLNAPLVEQLVVDRVRELTRGMVGRFSGESKAEKARVDLIEAKASLTRLLGRLEAADAADEPEAVEMVKAARERRDAAHSAYEDALTCDDVARRVYTADEVLDHGTLQGKRELIQAVIERVEIRRQGKGAERVTIKGRVE